MLLLQTWAHRCKKAATLFHKFTTVCLQSAGKNQDVGLDWKYVKKPKVQYDDRPTRSFHTNHIYNLTCQVKALGHLTWKMNQGSLRQAIFKQFKQENVCLHFINHIWFLIQEICKIVTTQAAVSVQLHDDKLYLHGTDLGNTDKLTTQSNVSSITVFPLYPRTTLVTCVHDYQHW